jgi:serine/threonine protein kinase
MALCFSAKARSVTHVSGMNCYPSVGKLKNPPYQSARRGFDAPTACRSTTTGISRAACVRCCRASREPHGPREVPIYMTQQTHFERLSGREATARERARTAPTLDDDDTDTFPILTDAGVAATPVSDDSPDEWQVGDIAAGRFVLEQRLGKGRYGTVFKALDRALSEPQIGVEHHVALQELPPWIAERATFIECLEQLRFHPQSWSHPNIAKVLEFGRDGTKYFLCEQLLEGASLRVVLDASAPDALEEHEVLAILRYVGDALNYSHAKDIVHGDLRLDNVFVTEAYEVKLTGFLPSTEPRPEPVFVEDPSTAGQPHPSDDVYSLACLAYELLTRRHPYGGNTPLEALRAGLTANPVLKLAPPRWQALSRGLALRRERRTANIPQLLVGLGVTGVETLHRAAKNVQSTESPRVVTPEEETVWPEITPAEPARSSPRPVASPAVAPPVSAPFAAQRPADPFTEIYAEPTARLMRSRPGRRRGSPVRTILGLVLAAGFVSFAYLNHAWLRDRAAGFIETTAALVLPRSVPTAAAPVATEPPAAPPPTEPATPAPPVAASTTEPEPAPTTLAPAPSDLPAPEASPQQPAAPAGTAPPRFVFAERTLTVNEWQGSARVLIRRTVSLDEEASVVWWTTDGTAVGDEDYAVLGARVARFAVGEDTQVLHVPLIGDSVPEARESFFVNLGGERAGRAAMQLEVFVLDDDR